MKRAEFLRHEREEARKLRRENPAEADRIGWEASNRLFERGIRPNAEKIARIVDRGGIAILVHAPADEETEAAAREIGWDGVSPVFEMSRGKAKRFARNLRAMGDSAAADWLTAKPIGRRRYRMFVITGYGTLCLNHELGRGWDYEPGTNDMAPNN